MYLVFNWDSSLSSFIKIKYNGSDADLIPAGINCKKIETSEKLSHSKWNQSGSKDSNNSKKVFCQRLSAKTDIQL